MPEALESPAVAAARILVIDDEEDIRESLDEAFRMPRRQPACAPR